MSHLPKHQGPDTRASERKMTNAEIQARFERKDAVTYNQRKRLWLPAVPSPHNSCRTSCAPRWVRPKRGALDLGVGAGGFSRHILRTFPNRPATLAACSPNMLRAAPQAPAECTWPLGDHRCRFLGGGLLQRLLVGMRQCPPLRSITDRARRSMAICAPHRRLSQARRRPCLPRRGERRCLCPYPRPTRTAGAPIWNRRSARRRTSHASSRTMPVRIRPFRCVGICGCSNRQALPLPVCPASGITLLSMQALGIELERFAVPWPAQHERLLLRDANAPATL